MAELKTTRTEASVATFIDAIEDERRRKDCQIVLDLMKKATRAQPKMWGTSIVGFGDYHYKYESGRENDWFIAGFSPRAQNLTLYLWGGWETHAALLKKLGKHKTGKSCLYINKLEDIDLATLRKMIEAGVKQASRTEDWSLLLTGRSKDRKNR